jgi:hypothetical protein
MAAAQKVSAATVQRIWNRHRLHRHRVESFKFSSDPQFAWKVPDIVGLYTNPPDKTDRIERGREEPDSGNAPGRRLFCRYVPACRSGKAHDYEHHGTTTLFAALNFLEKAVIGECLPQHRHQEFLNCLDRIDQSVDADLAIHLVLDNYGTHKHPHSCDKDSEPPGCCCT